MKFLSAVGIVIILGSFSPTSAFAQEKEEQLQEVQVPLKIQSFFYERYNNAKAAEWSKISPSGNTYYVSSFVGESEQVTKAFFDENGSIVQEIVSDKKPVLSAEIKFHIDLNYSRFRVTELRKFTTFKGASKVQDIYYQLSGNTKQDDVMLWFDKDFLIKSKGEILGLISMN